MSFYDYGKKSRLLPLLDEMVKGGLVSIEEVRIVRYGPDRQEIGFLTSTVAVGGSP